MKEIEHDVRLNRTNELLSPSCRLVPRLNKLIRFNLKFSVPRACTEIARDVPHVPHQRAQSYRNVHARMSPVVQPGNDS